jgi:hypothetical protein
VRWGAGSSGEVRRLAAGEHLRPTSALQESPLEAAQRTLFEMLAGEPPHTGSTAQAVLGRIITAEPPSAALSRSLSSAPGPSSLF